jgi:hypothetical protein
MIIKQYEIALPADYEMRIIRDRVATRGSSFDEFPGLGVKVFLIRERGRHGAEGTLRMKSRPKAATASRVRWD